MLKAVVLYKSKYGTTEQYARWLAQELDCDVFEASKVGESQLLAYDAIIYGGGIYAGGILGFSSFKKSFDCLKDKKLVLFAVGASTQGEKAVEEIRQRILTNQMKQKVRVFFLRGGLDYQRLGLLDRFLMFMMKKTIELTKKQDSDSKGILATYGKTVDFTNKKGIEPILSYIREEQE